MTTLFRTAPQRFTKTVVATSPSVGQAHVFQPTPYKSTKPITPKDTLTEPTTAHSMSQLVKNQHAGLFATVKNAKGLTSSQQYRFAHTDVEFPDLEKYRRDVTKDTTKPARETEDQRRAFTNAMYGIGAVAGILFGKGAVRKIVDYKSMPADQLALAAVEIDITTIPEGTGKTFEWRGKPVFVRHRTEKEIQTEKSVPVNELRHPQPDEERAPLNPNWVVTLGVCTHLGCVPIAGAGDFGGYYCPCHGSHYDTGGRIRKGPAPLNLEIPEYEFVSDTILKIGK